MLNTHELIMGADVDGRIYLRGEFHGSVNDATHPDWAIASALDFGLIKLLVAWRSSENTNTPACRGGPIDRYIYGLTTKGWAYKVSGGTDHLQNYLVSTMADAEAAHWGVQDDAEDFIGVRYPESSFDTTDPPHHDPPIFVHGTYRHSNMEKYSDIKDPGYEKVDIQHQDGVNWVDHPNVLVKPLVYPTPTWELTWALVCGLVVLMVGAGVFLGLWVMK